MRVMLCLCSYITCIFPSFHENKRTSNTTRNSLRWEFLLRVVISCQLHHRLHTTLVLVLQLTKFSCKRSHANMQGALPTSLYVAFHLWDTFLFLFCFLVFWHVHLIFCGCFFRDFSSNKRKQNYYRYVDKKRLIW